MVSIWDLSEMGRTAAGEAFTTFVVEAAGLGHFVTAAGEALARHGGQSLARWVVLDAVAEKPLTVAQIARVRGMARQPIQRIADTVVEDRLATYKDNPRHRRARLLELTPRGRQVLEVISARQSEWANAHGAQIGAQKLRQAQQLIAEIAALIEMPPT